jgi:hypothetical protein
MANKRKAKANASAKAKAKARAKASAPKSKLEVREVVKILELDPLRVGDNMLWFRIEVTRDRSARYRARVWRTEHQRVTPAFPSSSGGVAPDIVVDSSYLFDEVEGTSVKSVVDKTLAEIERRFVAPAAAAGV